MSGGIISASGGSGGGGGGGGGGGNQSPLIRVSDSDLSTPIYQNVGLAFLPAGAAGVPAVGAACPLCAYASAHPVQPAKGSPASDEKRFGLFHDVATDQSLCAIVQKAVRRASRSAATAGAAGANMATGGSANPAAAHAVHFSCARAFVIGHKKEFSGTGAGAECPVCNGLADGGRRKESVLKAKAPAGKGAGAPVSPASPVSPSADDDEEAVFAVQDSKEVLGGKARKREKQRYQCWVHLIEATGLRLPKSDVTVNPVCYVSAFGQTKKSKLADYGKTYSCLWDECFNFQASLDEEEFRKETIVLRMENHNKLWFNDVLGYIRIQAENVNLSADHEFYRCWTQIVYVSSAKASAGAGALGLHGKVQLSVCVLNEENFKADPSLPKHVYDLEVQMWKDLEHKKEVVDYDSKSSGYLQRKLDDKQKTDSKLVSEFWDIITLKLYRGQWMPKTDSGAAAWCDPFIEVHYDGLLSAAKHLSTKVDPNKANPEWNQEFQIPVPSDQPIFYNRLELILKDKNTFSKDEEIGRHYFKITDILDARTFSSLAFAVFRCCYS